MEIQPENELMQITKFLVPKQMALLQKVLDFAKSVVQCSNSKLLRDSPHQIGLILHGGGGVGKSQTMKISAQWTKSSM